MEILREFYDVRMSVYGKRKEWLVTKLEAEAARLSNQARFITEKIKGKLVLGEQCAKERKEQTLKESPTMHEIVMP